MLKKIIKNKYLIVFIAFLVWMTFFDENNFVNMYKRIQKKNDLQQSELVLKKQIYDAQSQLKLLNSNAASIEKYVREKYYFKKNNEDLFIVE